MKKERYLTILSVFAIIVVLGFILWGIPQYKVYARELNGKAQLKEAEWNRQITIEEAGAAKEAAKLKKEEDIIRAEGIAKANDIISKSITQEFIQWKWVEGLHDGSSEVIYVPTEVNLPLLEATRNQN